MILSNTLHNTEVKKVAYSFRKEGEFFLCDLRIDITNAVVQKLSNSLESQILLKKYMLRKMEHS